MAIGDYLRPSAAPYWSRCFGYARLNDEVEAIPDDEQDHDVREDGTACHWLAQEVWNGEAWEVGDVSPNGRVLTDEMFSAIRDYIAIIRKFKGDVRIEEKVPVSRAFPGVSDGTPDVWAFDWESWELTLLDLKFGFRFVDAFEHPQLIVYIITIITEVLCIAPRDLYRLKIKLGIYQPRAPNHEGALRWWKPKMETLLELWSQLATAAFRAYQKNSPCIVNPKCKTCTASYACQALQRAGFDAVETAAASLPAVMDNHRVGHELALLHDAQRNLEARIAGLETQADFELRKGRMITGYTLQPRRTLWKWREGVEDKLKAAGGRAGVEVMVTKPRTVPQLRGLLPDEVLTELAVKPDGGLQLKAIDPKEAARKFGTLNT